MKLNERYNSIFSTLVLVGNNIKVLKALILAVFKALKVLCLVREVHIEICENKVTEVPKALNYILLCDDSNYQSTASENALSCLTRDAQQIIEI